MVKKFVAAAFVTGALLTVSAGVAGAAPSGNPSQNDCAGVLGSTAKGNLGATASGLPPGAADDIVTGGYANCGNNR